MEIKLSHQHLVNIILNPQYWLKLIKLENTQRIRRIDSRRVPPNRSLSSQRYQLGDAVATAPSLLNFGIRSPSARKTRPRAYVSQPE